MTEASNCTSGLPQKRHCIVPFLGSVPFFELLCVLLSLGIALCLFLNLPRHRIVPVVCPQKKALHCCFFSVVVCSSLSIGGGIALCLLLFRPRHRIVPVVYPKKFIALCLFWGLCLFWSGCVFFSLKALLCVFSYIDRSHFGLGGRG